MIKEVTGIPTDVFFDEQLPKTMAGMEDADEGGDGRFPPSFER